MAKKDDVNIDILLQEGIPDLEQPKDNVEEEPQQVEQPEEEDQEALEQDQESDDAEPEADTESEVEGESESEDEAEEEPEKEKPEKEVEEVVVDYKALFGDEYDSLDKVKETINKAKELETKVAEIQDKKPEFVNEQVERLNGILKNSPDMDLNLATKLSSLDSETLKGMDDMALIRLKVQLQKPGIANDDRLISRQLAKQYKFMPAQEALDDMTDDEVQDLKDEVALSKIELAQDANNFRKEISELLSKATPDKVKPEDLQKQKDEIAKAWLEPSQKIIPKEISIPDEVWDKELLKFKIEDAEFAALVKDIPQYAADNNIPLTEESFKALSGQLLSNYVMGKLPAIIKAVKDKVKAETLLEAEKKYVNPSSKKTETKGKPAAKGINFDPLL